MIYNNLLYFLVAIFVFSGATDQAVPWLPAFLAAPLVCLLFYFYYRLAGRVFTRAGRGGATRYFRAEKKLSILAVVLFVALVFVFDVRYYLSPLSLGGRLPALENLAGLGLFFLLLSLMWLQARPVYQKLFHRSYSAAAFLRFNLQTNLPIVLPWIVLSLAFDLLLTLPYPRFTDFLLSPWGDLLFFLFFVVFIALFFPPMIRRLWNCQPMEDGPLRREIEQFCRSQNFSSDILYWPLFEGRVLTAGIMGIVPKFRYLLVTRALLDVLDKEELESVVAHEIGHVKKRHMVLYILLFLGFSILAGAAAEPLAVVLLSSNWFYQLLDWLRVSPEGLLTFLSSVLVLVLLVLYFRFLFGFFIRNFERQADLYVFKAQGSSQPLIRSFEKIAALSGNIRNKKNWHHFGLGERIDFLEKCENDRQLVRRQDVKVYVSLILYVFCLGAGIWALHLMKTDQQAERVAARYGLATLEYRVKLHPENSRAHQELGRLFLEHGMEKKAVASYTKALSLAPRQADIANNLAWLLLTAQDTSLRDPVRALQLAEQAARFGKGQGAILDTLATALWANGRTDEALDVEQEAVAQDPVHKKYYHARIEEFTRTKWKNSPENELDSE